MIHPNSQPSGVFVPTHLIFHTELPASVLVTWIQLRSLARDNASTSPVTLPELAAHLGIHTTRLNRHMAYLRDMSVLSWYEVHRGKIIVSFPTEFTGIQKDRVKVQEDDRSSIPVSERLEPPAVASYFPSRILGYLSFEDDDTDPLYIEHDLEILSKEKPQETNDISILLTCKPVEHVFLTK